MRDNDEQQPKETSKCDRPPSEMLTYHTQIDLQQQVHYSPNLD